MTFALCFSTLMGIAAAAFLVWCCWSLAWGLYDDWMQRRARRRNAQFDARVGRDCWKDIKGIHR